MDRKEFLECVAGSAALVPAGFLSARIAQASIPQPPAVRVGCCPSHLAAGPDGTGIEAIETLKELGFDYLELSVVRMMALNSYDFSVVKDRIKASGISCEVCNGGPLPSTIKVTGPNVDTVKIAEYIEPALKRAAELGAKVVICGIPDSRSVPEGFSPEKAWDQMVSFLKSLDKPAASNGITIAFEAINHRETNFLNLVAEGLKLVKEVNRENVKLVVDAYHLALEKENPNVILQAGDYVRHIHIASAEGRTFPKASDPDGYRVFFDNVKRINYRHRVSIEAYSSDLKKDGSESLALLRKLLA